METITLYPQWHDDRLFVAIGGKLRGQAFNIINNTPGRQYSRTHGGYLVPFSKHVLLQLKAELAECEIVHLAGWGEKGKPLPEQLEKAWV
ncbi:MAG: hypothetical protein ACKOE6_13455, partial [Flammeovirgaceae bacterium]